MLPFLIPDKIKFWENPKYLNGVSGIIVPWLSLMGWFVLMAIFQSLCSNMALTHFLKKKFRFRSTILKSKKLIKYWVVCRWWSCQYSARKQSEIPDSGFPKVFKAKKTKSLVFPVLNWTYTRLEIPLIWYFCQNPHCTAVSRWFLTATSLTDHMITFPLTFDRSKWLILVYFLSLYLLWKCQLLSTKAIQSCWSDHFVQQDEVE